MVKYKINLNDTANLRDLLQEAYRLADEQITQAQNEINKLSNATQLNEEPMDARTKYAKAINDYLGMKDKAISKKLEIAKIMSDVLHHNGDVSAVVGDNASKEMNFNFEDIKKMVDSSFTEAEEEGAKKITLNKSKKFK
jgi:hypothetical protein